MSVRWGLFSLFAFLSFACTTPSASSPDAATADAGHDPDAFARPDSPEPVDATVDAAAPDAPLPDGGTPDPELALVATFLGGISTYTIDPTSGALTRVTGSPFDSGAHYYGIAVDPSAQHAYAIDLDAGDLVAYHILADGGLMRFAGAALHVGGSPSAIAMDPAGHFLYVGSDSSIVALVRAADGTLSMPAGSATTAAGTPSYLAIDAAGRTLYASYSSAGGVSAFAITAATGALAELTGSPYAASAIFGGGLAIDPDRSVVLDVRFALHGLDVDASGALSPFTMSPFSTDVGADPSATSVAFDPTGHFAYTVNMANGHVSGFAVDGAAGTMTPVPGTAPSVSSAYSVAVDPSGRFVYVPSDSGHITGFVRAADGSLAPMGGAAADLDGLQPEMVIVRVPTP